MKKIVGVLKFAVVGLLIWIAIIVSTAPIFFPWNATRTGSDPEVRVYQEFEISLTIDEATMWRLKDGQITDITISGLKGDDFEVKLNGEEIPAKSYNEEEPIITIPEINADDELTFDGDLMLTANVQGRAEIDIYRQSNIVFWKVVSLIVMTILLVIIMILGAILFP